MRVSPVVAGVVAAVVANCVAVAQVCAQPAPPPPPPPGSSGTAPGSLPDGAAIPTAPVPSPATAAAPGAVPGQSPDTLRSDLPRAHAKRREVANALAYGGTLAGIGLALGAAKIRDRDTQWGVGGAGVGLIALGPSLGHFYADDFSYASGIRLAALGLLGVGAYALSGCAEDAGDCLGGEVAIIIGGIGMVATGVWDLATTSSAVDHFNLTHDTRLTLAPIATPDRRTAPGLAVTGRF